MRDPFVGDWKLDPARSRFIDLMTVRGLGGGTYVFELEGGAAETIAIDGTDQPGMPGTTLAVMEDDATHWRVVRKQDGHVLVTASWTLSDDRDHLTDDFTQLAPDGQVTLHVVYDYARTAAGPGFEGTWEAPVAMDKLPPATLEVRPYAAGGLSFIRPSLAITKNLELDGADHPVADQGARAGATRSARRVGAHAVEVVDKSKGEIRKTEQFEVSADLHTLTQTARPAGQRGANVLVFERCATRCS